LRILTDASAARNGVSLGTRPLGRQKPRVRARRSGADRLRRYSVRLSLLVASADVYFIVRPPAKIREELSSLYFNRR
jgi:hypothetical protein